MIAQDDYRLSHRGDELAASYVKDFTERLPGRYWHEVEQPLLAGLLGEALRRDLGEVRHLDVASGTGRVLAYLQPKTAGSTAIDISEEMLAHAKLAAPEASFVVGDASVMEFAEPFDLVTAFRFFLNAGPELRSAVLARIRANLADDGLLVANVHAQPYSSLGIWRTLKASSGRRSDSTLSIAAFRQLLEGHGFEVVGDRTYGYLPLTRKVGPGFLCTAFCTVDRLLNRLLPARNPFACCWLVAARPAARPAA